MKYEKIEMTSAENLQKDIGYINDFMTLYINKTTNIDENTQTALKRIEDALVVEKSNEEFLQNVEKTIFNNQIENQKNKLDEYLKSIEEKQQEYLLLVKKNANKIIELSAQIRIKKDAFENIINMCQKLDNNIANLGKKTVDAQINNVPVE